jgi:hypothetical protein
MGTAIILFLREPQNSYSFLPGVFLPVRSNWVRGNVVVSLRLCVTLQCLLGCCDIRLATPPLIAVVKVKKEIPDNMYRMKDAVATLSFLVVLSSLPLHAKDNCKLLQLMHQRKDAAYRPTP